MSCESINSRSLTYKNYIKEDNYFKLLCQVTNRMETTLQVNVISVINQENEEITKVD